MVPWIEVASNGYGSQINTGHTWLTVGVNARRPAFGDGFGSFTGLIDEVAVHGDLHQVVVAGGSRVDVLPPFAGG